MEKIVTNYQSKPKNKKIHSEVKTLLYFNHKLEETKEMTKSQMKQAKRLKLLEASNK